MNPQIEKMLDYLPSKEYDKAIKYFEENEIEQLKEFIESFIFKVTASLNAQKKHSKYYHTIDVNKLSELLKLISDDYYECLETLEYLNDCEKREFDETYLDYE